MSVSEHRPRPRDSTARWQTYADRLEAEVERLRKAEDLLRQIQDGKHSLPGALVQIERYFDAR